MTRARGLMPILRASPESPTFRAVTELVCLDLDGSSLYASLLHALKPALVYSFAMTPLLLSLCQNKRLKSVLLCLLLCGGTRVLLAVDLKLSKLFLSLRSKFTLTSSIRLLHDLYLALISRPSSGSHKTQRETLTCSSLPAAHSHSPQQTSTQVSTHISSTAVVSLGDPASDVMRESPVEESAEQPAPSAESDTASSESSAYNFAWQPPEPFESIHPISAAQLVPRRWPISRTEPPDVTNPYTHPELTPQNASTGYIPPYITDFTPDLTPTGWNTFIHPQVSEPEHHMRQNVLTNANILDEDNYRIVLGTMDQIFQKLKYDGVTPPPDTQLVLDIRWDRRRIGYYLATPQGRCLFWAEGKHVRPLFKRVTHVWSHSHIRHLMEAEFWVHFQLFPHIQTLPIHIVREIKGFLLFTCNDQLFNANTTSEYSTDEVNKALTIIDAIPREFIGAKQTLCSEIGYFMYIAGNIMSLNALHRFDNYHGQPNARWYRNDFLYDDSDDLPRTRFIQLVSPLLFYTPETYYQSLRNVMNDGNVFFEAWRTFVGELHQEWQQLTIIATVILATNVAFLAIPIVDNGEDPKPRSAAQICSYLSIVLSVCSILLGQLFSRYHRIKGWERFDERITENYDMLMDIGCSKLAVMYSLPYALLSWSLVGFLVAFLVMCFNGTQKVVQLVIGIPSAVFLLVMMYCIYKMRANDEERSGESTLLKLYTKIKDRYQIYSKPRSWRRNSTELENIPDSRPPSASIHQSNV
ncbi:hypothetical protein NP233_g5680 [Leucocoprinus birnbaumii]|uniref:Uncharacterized protein n=1 Tax=Leucocoprinus birnbaumii TaxID=56174 RepID=A0AAD5VSE0_9AGAR|nr:hypothetical protein NP233_g5680 [Leucocoprinus birnbaumii]